MGAILCSQFEFGFDHNSNVIEKVKTYGTKSRNLF